MESPVALEASLIGDETLQSHTCMEAYIIYSKLNQAKVAQIKGS